MHMVYCVRCFRALFFERPRLKPYAMNDIIAIYLKRKSARENEYSTVYALQRDVQVKRVVGTRLYCILNTAHHLRRFTLSLTEVSPSFYKGVERISLHM